MTTGEASNASEEQVTYGPSYEGFKGSESSKDIGDLFKSAVAVKDREKQDLIFGRQSYYDVLYADYTPCGPIYAQMKPQIKAVNSKTVKKNSDTQITSDSRLNADSKIVRRFKHCLNQYEMFYSLRQKAVDKIKSEQSPF